MSVEKVMSSKFVQWMIMFIIATCVTGFGLAIILPDARAAMGMLSLAGVLLAIVFYVFWNYRGKIFIEK